MIQVRLCGMMKKYGYVDSVTLKNSPIDVKLQEVR